MSGVGFSRRAVADLTGLCILKLALGAYVLRLGFTHVSDDDYARVVIAEQFAHAPKLDPSGTSWLPLPFWICGSVMWLAGRSLSVARAVAVLLGSISVALPYSAMRVAGVSRVAAIAATAVAMALPWNAWLGVATVPEVWTGALAGAAMLAMARSTARGWTACALLAASLSRYETWPACAVLAAVCAAQAVRGYRRETAFALLAIAGPVLWMAWNAHAHGSAIHFLSRVSTFRRSLGAAELPLREKVLAYPRALFTETPEAALLGIAAAAAFVLAPGLRARWALCGVCVLSTMAFLIVGDLGDGAPTHHPERALSPIWWALIGMGVDAIAASIRPLKGLPSRLAMGLLAAMGLVWAASLPSRWSHAPGETDAERREPQIARGLEMRSRDVARADVTPCSFEHFALIAAWGAPERAHVEPSMRRPPTPDCPRVYEVERNR